MKQFTFTFDIDAVLVQMMVKMLQLTDECFWLSKSDSEDDFTEEKQMPYLRDDYQTKTTLLNVSAFQTFSHSIVTQYGLCVIETI